MNSMTGYGRGEATTTDLSVVIELKSVNHRFRDINLRAPREYGAIEPRIAAVLKRHFRRGRIDCFVRRVSVGGPQTVTPDLALAEATYSAMRAVAQRLGRPETDVRMEDVFAHPGVLVFGEVDVDVTAEWMVVESAVLGAVDHLCSMRAEEGAALRSDLTAHLERFVALRGEVALLAESVQAALLQRLNRRLVRLLAETIEPERLAQEAALLAEKADIAEELARLSSHIDQFREALSIGEPVGRRLEFLVQEMNREVNTLGAKATEQEVSRHVVEMKTVLERMREQAANVE